MVDQPSTLLEELDMARKNVLAARETVEASQAILSHMRWLENRVHRKMLDEHIRARSAQNAKPKAEDQKTPWQPSDSYFEDTRLQDIKLDTWIEGLDVPPSGTRIASSGLEYDEMIRCAIEKDDAAALAALKSIEYGVPDDEPCIEEDKAIEEPTRKPPSCFRRFWAILTH